jgi:mannose-6-phosphate isomerase-like protein (cupin superfamily)
MHVTTAGPRLVGPRDAKEGFLGSIGVRFMIDGPDAGERFSLVEHPMSPRALAAPLHLHTREDEYSYVLEGRMGALLGDDVVEAGPGDLVFKPRNQWHTFWNAGDEPCRILEIIAPAGSSASSTSSSTSAAWPRRPGGPRRAQRALRPRDAAGDVPRAVRALRAADGRAAVGRLDAPRAVVPPAHRPIDPRSAEGGSVELSKQAVSTGIDHGGRVCRLPRQAPCAMSARRSPSGGA